MIMEKTCPVSGKIIDGKTPRFTAALVFVSAIAFIVSGFNVLVLTVLTLDFFMRSFFDFKYSPFSAAGDFARRALNIRGFAIDVAPKVFAARMGLFMCGMLCLFQFLEIAIPRYVISSVLAVFSFLEVAFNFCMGCAIYNLTRKKEAGNFIP